ncbi:carboxypeptidase-like regulatory domain-containing protein [Gaopeijia maritima]|uniref:carboxypeptidase-like regulatory domain-containing protein n=1 Tax=Gaopeijia maritima TaxID=3119007 RepID=UPI0032720AAA
MSGGLLRWVALALITLGAAPVGASAQVILGRVLDDESGLGVPDVEVMLLDDRAQPVGERRLSGANGGFVFSVDPGHYQFSAFRIGYGPGTSPFVEVQRGDSVEVEFRIAQEAIVLDPLTVTASARPWYEHMKPPALWEYYERSEHMTSLVWGVFSTATTSAPCRACRCRSPSATCRACRRWLRAPVPGSRCWDAWIAPPSSF